MVAQASFRRYTHFVAFGSLHMQEEALQVHAVLIERPTAPEEAVGHAESVGLRAAAVLGNELEVVFAGLHVLAGNFRDLDPPAFLIRTPDRFRALFAIRLISLGSLDRLDGGQPYHDLFFAELADELLYVQLP